MKRLVFLFCLLFGITAAAQELQNSARYEHFIELRNESDTLRMKQMLDDWGAKDAEYYAAWSNYCSIMAEETEDSSWLGLAVNWIKMGLEEYPDDVLLLLKQPQVLFDNEQFRDALPVLQELEEKGLDDASSWFFSSSIYTMMNDRERARQYLRKMIQEEDEDYRAFAEETLQAFDQDDVPLGVDAALRRAGFVPGVMVAVDIDHRRGGEAGHIAEVGSGKISAGEDQIRRPQSFLAVFAPEPLDGVVRQDKNVHGRPP